MTTWQDRVLIDKYEDRIEDWYCCDEIAWSDLHKILEDLIREARETKEQ